MADNARKIRIREDVVLREEDEGAFLFDPENGRLCYLNMIGIDVWNMCRQPVSEDTITRLLFERYPEESQDRIESDCDSFLGELDRLGLIAHTDKEEQPVK